MTALFKSQRCTYRAFGIYASGETFADKHPQLAEDIKNHDIDYLMSKDYPARDALASAIRRLPEYLSFLKTTCQKDFFFAAFDQSKKVKGQPEIKKTGPKDVEKFVLERIKNQYTDPRLHHEFVMEVGGKVAGYGELFDSKTVDGKKQCEWGVFINPDQQAHGYGKEVLLALTDYAFKTLKMDRVFATADPDNLRSVNNILRNGGGVKVGEALSPYTHLDGGGKKRDLFYIDPTGFYAAVALKGNAALLMQPPLPPAGNDVKPWMVKGLARGKPPHPGA